VPSADRALLGAVASSGEAAGLITVGPQIADVVSRLRRAMRRAARAEGTAGQLPGGLSVAQLEFLSCLAENPGARPSQLARLLRLAPSSVATLVNGLLRAGFVTRTGGQPDRRTASLLLTPEGSAAVACWQEVNERILQAAIAALAPASRDAIDASLAALRELTAAIDALADSSPVQTAGPGQTAGPPGQAVLQATRLITNLPAGNQPLSGFT
jgi:DNA-binding MarR family transcriptional regulator